ncbi:hypothetical protein EWM64_g10191 [Hericium alpestre]|uniref:Sugar phosphate transporter domain-containing protein n=1 Tax=Hericium alpestre TaxID=135208 RepID=A0A4Y9ZIZ3_9AGAM|nr:hypothetical protein EWM64_g10191 [Hericium alpestre]
MQLLKGLVPMIGLNVIGLSSNNYTLKYVDASFYQVARGLVLPLTVGTSYVFLHSRPSLRILLSCALVTSGFFIGVFLDGTHVSSLGIFFGVAFLPDLAAVDPYYMLPVLSAVLMNVQLKMGAADMVGGDRQMMTHMINFFRVVSVLGIYIMGSFPVGLNLYVATGIGAMIVQTAVLRVPAVRRLLNIPIVKRTQPVQPVKFSDSIEYVKKYLAEQKALAAKQGVRRKF